MPSSIVIDDTDGAGLLLIPRLNTYSPVVLDDPRMRAR